MVRDPIKVNIQTIKDVSKPRKIFPVFFWKQCMGCGKEYRRESMWKSLKPFYFDNYYGNGPEGLNLGILREFYGCQHCYPDINKFHEQLITFKDIKRWNEKQIND